MSGNILHRALIDFRSGRELPAADSTAFLDSLLAEQDETLLASLLTAWNDKGITEDELFGLASIMRSRCTPLRTENETLVDIVGTGGSTVKTFNVSTAAAFVVAGAGTYVAKHGNRAASSSTGSADVLEKLGIEPSVDPEVAAKCLEEIGICFMFAPKFHRLSPVLGKVRRKLGFPTIFNILGPLCNPAGASHRLIGVWDQTLIETVARVLSRLGTKRSWIVNGTDGLDEITLAGPTNVAEISNGDVRYRTINPEDFGRQPSSLETVRVTSPEESARLVRDVLTGTIPGSPAEIIVLMSAAAAIHLATNVDLSGAYASARGSLESGAAFRKLEQLAEMTNR
jgi:anthranilate phosphoribosyltransferase